MTRIIVNTISTKKGAGGAFQIATNFVLKTLEKDCGVEWFYFTSSDLDEVVGENFKNNSRYFVFPTQPSLSSYFTVKKQLRDLEDKIAADLVYSITAPCYHKFQTLEVMRFTNPWVTHPNRYSWASLTFKEKLKMKSYCLVQRLLIKHCKYFVTQTEEVQRGLMRILGIPSENINVIHNVLPSVIKKIDSSHIDKEDGFIDISCIAAPFRHKNLDIVPKILKILKEDFDINNVRIHLTIPKDNVIWNSIYNEASHYNISDRIINHGRVSQVELASIYKQCSYALLPTLLEVFSASSIEAMYFNLNIIATDFNFNRDVLSDTCLYYEPMNPYDAAKKIHEYIENCELQEKKKLKMQERIRLYDDYDKHFRETTNFLIKTAEKVKIASGSQTT